MRGAPADAIDGARSGGLARRIRNEELDDVQQVFMFARLERALRRRIRCSAHGGTKATQDQECHFTKRKD